MLCECVVGSRCRWLVGISGHTHHSVPLYCSWFLRRSLFSAFLHGQPSPFNICNTHTLCTSPVSSVICSSFPLEVYYDDLTFLQVSFHLVFVNVSTFHRFSSSQTEALRTSAVSVLGYLACASHVRHSSAVT